MTWVLLSGLGILMGMIGGMAVIMLRWLSERPFQ